MELTVKIDLKGVNRMLDGLAKDQVPFATAYALTQTAKAAQAEVEREIPRVFDRPTPFTQKPVYTRPATKSRLTAEVKIKDTATKGNPAVRWLLAEIKGGPRSRKGFENLLQHANGRVPGGVMPVGWYAAPTRYAPKDAYGNVPGSAINRILSQMQASRDPGTRETAKARKSRNSIRSRAKSRPARYFASMPGSARTAHLAPGLYERIGFGFGSSIRPIFLYTQTAPRYRQRLRFYDIVNRTVVAQLGLQFKRGVALAKRTAR